jgi:prophage tail gpP-like protein
MPSVILRVNGRDFSGWTSVRVTRGIEAMAGSFELGLTQRWPGQVGSWEIRQADKAQVFIRLDKVGADSPPLITGYVDGRTLSIGKDDHRIEVSGRDQAGALVDCSAFLDKWEFYGIPLLKFAQDVAQPYGVKVRTTEKDLPRLPTRITIDPGETAFDALERGCRMCGVLPVSDGSGALVLTRAGRVHAATALVEGQNILSASVTLDASGRYRRYIVMGQHPGTDEYMGDATAEVRGEAFDMGVSRAERVLVVRAETAVTPELARARAQWEASVRAARCDRVSVTVAGWTQGNGSLWPVNAIVRVRAPHVGVDGDLLITQATYSLDPNTGTTTQLTLMNPKVFTPMPYVAPGSFPELANGVKPIQPMPSH